MPAAQTGADPSARGTHALLYPARRGLGAVGGVALVVFALLVVRQPVGPDNDFTQLYVAGLFYRAGAVPYGASPAPVAAPPGVDLPRTRAAYYYPPACNMLAAPLTVVSLSAAATAYKYLAFGLLAMALWLFAGRALPGWPREARLCAVGLTCVAGCVRWDLVQLQPTALIVALLLAFGWACLTGRWPLAVCLAVLVGLKPTYLLPALALLVYLRRPRLALAAAVIILAWNGLAVLHTGPRSTVAAYRAALAHFGTPGNITDPRALESLSPYIAAQPASPLAHHPLWSGRHLNWGDQQLQITYTASAWLPQLRRARLAQAAFNAGLAVMLCLLWMRVRRRPDWADRHGALLFALLTTASLLVVYHQRYDAVALVPGVLVCIEAVSRHRSDRIAWAGFGAGVVFAYLMTAKAEHTYLMRVVVPYGLLPLAPVCGYLTLVVFGSLAIMAWRSLPAADARP